MTHPENRPPEEDDDGGTFKLKPGGQSKSEPEQDGLDSTMKLRKVGGGNPAASNATPPPPPSPLGQPTGPANPQNGYADTSVMPQSGGSQTGFQPSAPPPPGQPGGPLGQGSPPPQQQGQQPYGQQPYGQQPPPQQQGGPPYGQPGGAPGAAPAGVKRISLFGFVSGGAGLLYIILLFALSGGSGLVFISALPYILTSVAVIGVAFALPRGMLHSKGMRTTGIVLVFVHGAWSLFGLLNLLNFAGGLSGAFVAIGSILLLAVVGATGYSAFVYYKDQETKAWFQTGASSPQQAAGGAVPPPGAPGQPGRPQQPGQPQQGQPQQPGQPGAYPPPPGYQQGQQPGQPPYGR